MKHVFGPVPSRRLGRSLGIDLIPFKSCTFDCLYCQLGSTGATTIQSQKGAQIEEVLVQLKKKLNSKPDYITLSGSGEPTLYEGIGELIDRIHAMTDVPVAVITNGSLLWDQTVRKRLTAADVVLPSLDAGDEEMFRRVNRPHGGISFDQLIDGLVSFRKTYLGQFWLEVLLLAGLTDMTEQVTRIAALASRIRPDRVQLNTCVRPGADSSAQMVDRERLFELARLFTPEAEVIADYQEGIVSGEPKADNEEILSMLSRRPCTANDVAVGLGIQLHEALEGLRQLVKEGRASRRSAQSGATHYVASKQN